MTEEKEVVKEKEDKNKRKKIARKACNNFLWFYFCVVHFFFVIFNYSLFAVRLQDNKIIIIVLKLKAW